MYFLTKTKNSMSTYRIFGFFLIIKNNKATSLRFALENSKKPMIIKNSLSLKIQKNLFLYQLERLPHEPWKRPWDFAMNSYREGSEHKVCILLGNCLLCHFFSYYFLFFHKAEHNIFSPHELNEKIFKTNNILRHLGFLLKWTGFLS